MIQRATLMKHLGKIRSQKAIKDHRFAKSVLRFLFKGYVGGSVVSFGLVAWYWFDYDLNIWNPKLTKYITDRLG